MKFRVGDVVKHIYDAGLNPALGTITRLYNHDTATPYLEIDFGSRFGFHHYPERVMLLVSRKEHIGLNELLEAALLDDDDIDPEVLAKCVRQNLK